MCDEIREGGNSAGPARLVITVRPVWAGHRVDRLSPRFPLHDRMRSGLVLATLSLRIVGR